MELLRAADLLHFQVRRRGEAGGAASATEVLALDFAARALLAKSKARVRRSHAFEEVLGFQPDGEDASLLRLRVRAAGSGECCRYAFAFQSPAERRTFCRLLQRVLDGEWALGDAPDLAAALHREVLCRGRIMKRSAKPGGWKRIYAAVVRGKMLRFDDGDGDAPTHEVRSCVSLAGARVSIEGEDAFDVVAGDRRVALRCGRRAYRDQWLVAFAQAIREAGEEAAEGERGRGERVFGGERCAGGEGGGRGERAGLRLFPPSPGGGGSGSDESSALGMSAHSFLSFSVGAGAEAAPRLLHVDARAGALEVVHKGAVERRVGIADVRAIERVGGADGGGERARGEEGFEGEVRVVVRTRDGWEGAFAFQAVKELVWFMAVMADLRTTGRYDDRHWGLERRVVLRKGQLLERRRGGGSRARFAVLVRGKLFLFRGEGSRLPLSTVWLRGAEVRYDGERTIEIARGGRSASGRGEAASGIAFLRAASAQEAGEWHEAVSKEVVKVERMGSFSGEEQEARRDGDDDADCRGGGGGEGGLRTPVRSGETEGGARTRRGTWTEYEGFTPAHTRTGLREEVTGEGSKGFDQIVTLEEVFAFWGVERGRVGGTDGGVELM